MTIQDKIDAEIANPGGTTPIDNDELIELVKLAMQTRNYNGIVPIVKQWVDGAAAEVVSLRERLNEAVEYTEVCDAMLDGIIKAREDPKDPTSKQLWLKDRLQLLIDQNEQAADKLSDCWLFIDSLARITNGGPVRQIALQAEKLLRKQQCPGWKDASNGN